jgi:hypothetical protein
VYIYILDFELYIDNGLYKICMSFTAMYLQKPVLFNYFIVAYYFYLFIYFFYFTLF